MQKAGRQKRLRPLTVAEYESDYSAAKDLPLIERIYAGGMATNQLRAALWPYMFGLVKHRGHFKRVQVPSSVASDSINSNEDNDDEEDEDHHHDEDGEVNHHNHHNHHDHDENGKDHHVENGKDHHNDDKDSEELYVYIEHDENTKRWIELEQLYCSYQSQWQSINEDQELRFSVFRERKSLIKHDVIRSDRSHPFYADCEHNLAGGALTSLLMTYMMYDFDIGYLQGMSDIAAPILYVFNGDIVKAFWVFVEVMKLFRRNFEYSQKTIHFQLDCLFSLIKTSDPDFADYLRENGCSNCFFAFRFIVCQFKRELMKDQDENSYTNVLQLWDTIWSVQKRHELLTESNRTIMATYGHSNGFNYNYNDQKHHHQYHYNHYKPKHHQLTETEKFVLSLCLSLIKLEREQIIRERLDASDIHQLFMNPHLGEHIKNFIENAYHIYHRLNTDRDMQLVKGIGNLDPPAALTAGQEVSGSPDTYDLLRDYDIIISPTSWLADLLA